MLHCDNFRLYIATLADNVANLLANANRVFKIYKAGTTAHSYILILLPTVSK